MIDRILKISNKEIVIVYWHKPAITIYSEQGCAMYYVLEILKLEESICTTLKAV